MILGERSVRRIVREISPESTPTVAARSLMLENFPSSGESSGKYALNQLRRLQPDL